VRGCCLPQGTAIAAARHSKVLGAEKFELISPDGNKRGVLEVTPEGTGAIALYDASGKSRAELTVKSARWRRRGILRQRWQPTDRLGDGLSGRSGIALYNAKGHELAGLTVADNGETSLTLYDLSGRARAGLGVAANGQPALALFDQNGKNRAELHLKADGSPGLALADDSGKTVAGLPMSSASSP